MQGPFASGYTPVVFDNLSTGHAEFVKWGPLIVGDIRDGGALADAIAGSSPIAVLHFAAEALVGESVSSPAKYWQVNAAGTLNLLEVMRRVHIDKLVFSSTCAVYGDVTTLPVGRRAQAAEKPLWRVQARRRVDD